MTEQRIDGSKVVQVVTDVVGRLGKSADELIPILNSVNREIGYLPAEALEEISKQLQVPKSQLFSVATARSANESNPCSLATTSCRRAKAGAVAPPPGAVVARHEAGSRNRTRPRRRRGCITTAFRPPVPTLFLFP